MLKFQVMCLVGNWKALTLDREMSLANNLTMSLTKAWEDSKSLMSSDILSWHTNSFCLTAVNSKFYNLQPL